MGIGVISLSVLITRGIALLFKRSTPDDARLAPIKEAEHSTDAVLHAIQTVISTRYGNPSWLKSHAVTDGSPTVSASGISQYLTPLHGDILSSVHSGVENLYQLAYVLDHEFDSYNDKVEAILEAAHHSDHVASDRLVDEVSAKIKALSKPDPVKSIASHHLLALPSLSSGEESTLADVKDAAPLKRLTTAEIARLTKSLKTLVDGIETLTDLSAGIEMSNYNNARAINDLKELSASDNDHAWDHLEAHLDLSYDGFSADVQVDRIARRQMHVALAIATYIDRSLNLEGSVSVEGFTDYDPKALHETLVQSNEAMSLHNVQRVAAGITIAASVAAAVSQLVGSYRAIFGDGKKSKRKKSLRGSSGRFASDSPKETAEEKAVAKERQEDVSRSNMQLDEVLTKYYTNASWVDNKRFVVGTVDASDISPALTVNQRMPFALIPAIRTSASELHGYAQQFVKESRDYCERLVKAATPGSTIRVSQVKGPDYQSHFHDNLLGSHSFSEYDSSAVHLNKTGMVTTLPALERRDVVSMGQVMLKLSNAINFTGQQLTDLSLLYGTTVEGQLAKVGASDADKQAVRAALSQHRPRILENMLTASAAALNACASYIDRSIKKADE